MLEVEKAYIAGIIDGEGSIGLYKPKKTKRGYFRIKEFLVISNTNLELLTWIKEKLSNEITHSGKNLAIYLGKHKDIRDPKYKISHRLFVMGRPSIFKTLKLVEPYLIVKRKQAKLLIKFIEQRMREMKKGGYHTHFTEEYLIKYYYPMKELNAKGQKL